MAENHDVFGSTIVFKQIFEDDLGHLARAGLIEDGAVDRVVWLRILDGYGLPTDAIVRALDVAREIGGVVTGSQLPSRPFFFDVDSVPALGFDYVAGQPLNRVLTRARDEAFPLQPDNSLLIIEKIALALAAGEAVEYSGEKLAHGFLHPGLIHLSNDGDATVTGFGLGHALLGSLSTPDTVPGARAYLAPEILGGAPPSQTGDVYSLGAILFHLLTGTALPVSTDDRSTALDAAHLAWDGEVLPTDIKKILLRSLAPTPNDRYDTASAFRKELDRLLYGGAYSPTTFNLALFMDRLFRAEIEAEEEACEAEREIEVSVDLTPDPIAPDPEPEPDAEAAAPEAVPPPPSGRRNRGVWAAVAAVAVVGVAAVIFWIGRQSGPQEPPPTPTPTAEEISAQRQAQEDRLRTLTQEMVKEMMVEREEAIREELIARQARIEELQLRLQQSERRARTSTVAAAKEAETQKELMKEIEEQEKAQRQQEEALETERQEALESAAREARLAADEAAGGAAVAVVADNVVGGEEQTAPAAPAPTMVPPTPSPRAPEPTERPETTAVTVGQFFPPAEADTLPVVIKSQSLEWPRNAARSKGKGVVVVQLTVNATGGVDEVEVLRADHTGWGIPEAAVEAATGYRYKPGTKNGVAITTHAFVTWRYDFTLE